MGPISLVGCWYKLLAKILANRLKSVMPLIVSPFQGAFVAKRQILDGVLIANELIDSRKRSKVDGFLLKIDLEKAYDHVDWNFVDYMLLKFGFGETWLRWMHECISTTSFSVLVNGSPSKLFKISRGIRQGDPLSPFLFTIVVEALSSLLVKAREMGVISGFVASRNGEVITHLQFADDTILFSSTKREEIMALKRILRCFQLVSGLKVNIFKSLLVGVGCSEETTQSLAAMLHCKWGRLPLLYLGLPIGVKSRSKSLWDPVIHKFEKKLSSWKRQYLSLGGRITLIKDCLSNIPVYYMSLFKMPKAVVERLDRICRNFLWEDKSNKKNMHLMKWSEVIKPK